MSRLIVLSVALALLGLGSGCPKPATPQPAPAPTPEDSSETPTPATTEAAPPEKIRFKLTPAEGGSELMESAKALATYLEAELGIPVEVTVPQDYGALITDMTYGHTDFAALSPLPFVKAEKEAGARVLLKSLRNGAPFYYSAIFVRADSPAQEIRDLEGKKMAFGDQLSTAGTIFPAAGLMEMGLEPEKFFGEVAHVGNHENTVLSVWNKEYDAGATFCNSPDGEGGAWAQYVPEHAQEFRVIWVSEPIPADTISVKDTFQDQYPVTTEKVKAAMLKLNDTPEGQMMLTELYRIDGLVEAKSEDYEVVREAARLVDVPIE